MCAVTSSEGCPVAPLCLGGPIYAAPPINCVDRGCLLPSTVRPATVEEGWCPPQCLLCGPGDLAERRRRPSPPKMRPVAEREQWRRRFPPIDQPDRRFHSLSSTCRRGGRRRRRSADDSVSKCDLLADEGDTAVGVGRVGGVADDPGLQHHLVAVRSVVIPAVEVEARIGLACPLGARAPCAVSRHQERQ